jgi:hypothetical protein
MNITYSEYGSYAFVLYILYTDFLTIIAIILLRKDYLLTSCFMVCMMQFCHPKISKWFFNDYFSSSCGFSFSQAVTSYAGHLERKHDMLLGRLFEHGTYNKLYSYRHLINGFAVHISPEQVKTWESLILGLISF